MIILIYTLRHNYLKVSKHLFRKKENKFNTVKHHTKAENKTKNIHNLSA